mgnify:CR=1 FL=1
MLRLITLILIIASFLIPSILNADEILSGKMVKQAIKSFLAQNNISAVPLINEKRVFPNCKNDLSISPTLGSWKTVTVQCKGKSPWKIIIRNKFNQTQGDKKTNDNNEVKNSSYKASFKEIKVAAITRSIRRGDVITPSDVIEISIPKNKATDIFPNSEDLIGRRAKTTIIAMKPIYSRQLEPNFMISEDMPVTIIHNSSYVSVQMEGIALEEGQYGDWISVKNIKSGRIILAKVIDEKKVSI